MTTCAGPRSPSNEAIQDCRPARSGVGCPLSTTFLPFTTALEITEIGHSFREVTNTTYCGHRSIISALSLYPVADARAQLGVAQAQARQAEAQVEQARVELDRHIVRAPSAMEVLQVDARAGEYAGTQGTASVLMKLGATKPLHVRLDIDENQIEKIAIGQPAVISARGDAKRQVKAVFVRAEPLIIPKRSLTNSATERVDIRVLQLIFALPEEGSQFFVGQQVDGFVPAKAKQ